jgi:hypothetical protein
VPEKIDFLAGGMSELYSLWKGWHPQILVFYHPPALLAGDFYGRKPIIPPGLAIKLNGGFMRRFSIFHPIFLAWFHAPLYRDVRKNWGRAAFAYLLLLVALCVLPMVIQMQLHFNSVVREEAPGLIDQLPVITIEDGILSTDREEPICVHLRNDPQCLIVIDTRRIFDPQVMRSTKVFISDTKIEIAKSAVETRIYSLESVQAMTITQEDVWRWVGYMQKYFVAIFFVVTVIFLFVFRLAYALLYVPVGIVAGKIFKADLKFAELFSLGIVSMTPPMLTKEIVDLMGVHVPLQGLIFFTIGAGYMIYAVRSCTTDAE